MRDGRAGNGICKPVKKIDGKTLKAFVTPTARKSAIIVTGELRPYRTVRAACGPPASE